MDNAKVIHPPGQAFYHYGSHPDLPVEPSLMGILRPGWVAPDKQDGRKAPKKSK